MNRNKSIYKLVRRLVSSQECGVRELGGNLTAHKKVEDKKLPLILPPLTIY